MRIHDILVWIRIRGSMPLTNGSGSGSPDPSIFIIDLLYIFCILLFEVAFTSFFKDKKSKRSNKTVKIKVFLTTFALWQKDPDPYLWRMDPDPDPGGPKTCGSGSGFGSGSATLLLQYRYGFGMPMAKINLSRLILIDCREPKWPRLQSELRGRGHG